MSRPIVQPKDRLTPEDIKSIPFIERGKYIEAYLSTLVRANGRRGLTLRDIEKTSGFPKGTLTKYLELLFSKREVYRVKVGKSAIYYPNGRISDPLHERDMVFDNKKYRITVIDNSHEGKSVYIQEKEVDSDGFEDVVGGVMLPLEHVGRFVEKLSEIRGLSLNSELER